jgi:putative endonuclease
MFFTYILRSMSTGRFYIGCTQNVEIRLTQHNAGKTTSTRPYRPWELAYIEAYPTLIEARKRERQIKSWKNREYMVRTLGTAG